MVDIRIQNPLDQPAARRRIITRRSELGPDTAEVGAVVRLADDRIDITLVVALGILGSVVGMAGEAAALAEEPPALAELLFIACGNFVRLNDVALTVDDLLRDAVRSFLKLKGRGLVLLLGGIEALLDISQFLLFL